MTATETIQFAANFAYDCTNHVRHFVVTFDTTGMDDHRDLEAAMVRHAEGYLRSTDFGTDLMVTFGGIRTDWKRAPKSGVIETTPAPGAFWIHYS